MYNIRNGEYIIILLQSFSSSCARYAVATYKCKYLFYFHVYGCDPGVYSGSGHHHTKSKVMAEVIVHLCEDAHPNHFCTNVLLVYTYVENIGEKDS